MATTRTNEQLDWVRASPYEYDTNGHTGNSDLLRYGVQPTPTTCSHCGAPRTCCGGAKA